ncbi:uncharacterized protein si:ch211-248a14.8 [Lampris incognitus]|uniref:uncharacterized protein si:ch211-248a14.8 n=1 Tax=Lampris incognitus TaxID=2546036 RepID=UPI0024B571DC|nr:uncharacterized protein si:ch211-248a14.8 [Lampris incognitus]
MAMWARANSSNTGLFAVTTRLLALLTIGWSHGLKLAVPPSSHITVIIAILSGISVIITASQGLPDMDLMEYIYAPLGLIFHSLALTWIAKVSEVEHCHSPEARVSVFNVYYTHLVNQSLVLGPLCLLHPDGPRQVLSHSSWHSLLFDGYLLAILLLGMMLNLLTGLTALQFSPFAAALLHSARELTQPFLKLL